MDFVYLVAGLAGLWLGTKATIRGAVDVAERLGVSEFVIGIAVLSIGSDLPELAIAVDAAIKNLHSGDASDVVVGSALGSTLGQIGFVLGIAALLGHLTLSRKIVVEQGIALLGSILLLVITALDGYVSQAEGAFLIAAYGGYLLFILTGATGMIPDEEEVATDKPALAIFLLFVGLVIITISAEVTVSSATHVAAILGVEQAFVAIIVIGLGSSLPELSISLGAIMERRVSLSVGNLFGSNVFDTLVPIGVAAAIAGLDFKAHLLREEVPFLFLLTLVVLFFFFKSGVRKREGVIVLGLYVAYVVTEFLGAF